MTPNRVSFSNFEFAAFFVPVCRSWMTTPRGTADRGSPVSEDAAAGRTPRYCHAAPLMNTNMSIIPFPWKMLYCKHCNSPFTSIRTARSHHPRCPAVKDSELACREFTGCACDSCFVAPSEPIQILQMAPILPPGESDSASSESAFERATSFGKKATMLFTHVRFCSEMADSDTDAAWHVMKKLQDIAETCCSMAAVLVHRNKSDSGLKKKPFKPLR